MVKTVKAVADSQYDCWGP